MSVQAERAECFGWVTSSALTGEQFAAMVCVCVIVETAIRMSWLLAEGGGEADVRIRVARLEKRDLRQIVDAPRAMECRREVGPILANADELIRRDGRAHLVVLGG